ncbi:MAG TPA: DUF2934 domain-containing protein [Candidatus Limnocylindria bacterium]|nr:DUF2934 domain-containing protein [Candidatus Limnocylindria bacterium]
MTANTPLIDSEPSHDEVALNAFLKWEKEGRQHGYDLRHWLRAEAELRSLKQKKTEAIAKPWPPAPATTRTLSGNGKQKLTTDMKRTTTVKPKPVTKTTASHPARPAVKTKR